jgi:hypothetical protein
MDAEELENAEYEEREDYGSYDGPNPPRGTILKGRIKKMWYKLSDASSNPMLVVIWEAEGNKGDKKVYNGIGIWDRIVFTKKTAFRFKPFCSVFGITVTDVYDRMTGEEDDGMGCPVTKIGKWTIDSAKSGCRVTTKMGKATPEYPSRVEISKWMPADEDADADADDDTDADSASDAMATLDDDGGGKKGKKDKKGKKAKKGKDGEPF